MTLRFLEGRHPAGTGGRARVQVGENEIELDVFVGNAHYDPTTCEEVVRWAGKG